MQTYAHNGSVLPMGIDGHFLPKFRQGEKLTMKSKGDILGTVEQISAHNSAYELVDEYGFLPKELQDNQDFCDFLRHFDDYECFCYFCVNDSTIICADSLNGYVISVCSADELITGVLQEYEEYYK